MQRCRDSIIAYGMRHEKTVRFFANILFTCETYTQQQRYMTLYHTFSSIKSGKAAGVCIACTGAGCYARIRHISLSVVCFSPEPMRVIYPASVSLSLVFLISVGQVNTPIFFTNALSFLFGLYYRVLMWKVPLSQI